MFTAIDREVETSRRGRRRSLGRPSTARRAGARQPDSRWHQRIRPLSKPRSWSSSITTPSPHGLHDGSVSSTATVSSLLNPRQSAGCAARGRITPILSRRRRSARFDVEPRSTPRQPGSASCAASGCTARVHSPVVTSHFDRCEIHHIVPWELGGLTDLANLLPTCSYHHHLVHEGGWSLHLAPDRLLTIRQPDGDLFATVPIQISPTRRNDRVIHDVCRRGRERALALRS